MPFQTNCPSCGKNMLLLESMYGKPKRCRHCDKIFRVGGGPLPTEAELAASEAEGAKAPAVVGATSAAKPKPVVRIVVDKRDRVDDVIPLADDRPARRPLEDEPPPRRTKGGAPLWVVLVSIGGLLVALGVTGFLIWKATADRAPQPRAADPKKTNDPKDDDKKEDRKPVDDGPIVPREDPTRNLTANKFRLLRTGMSPADTMQILRAPANTASAQQRDPANPGRLISVLTFTWIEGANSIRLTFRNNQLVNGRATINGTILQLGG